MNEILLSISGQTPSHKNSKQIARFRNGKTALMNNKRYLAWRGSAIAQIQGQTDARGLEGVKIEASFFVEDRRRRDLDNMLASVLDALAESSVIADSAMHDKLKIRARILYTAVDALLERGL